MKVLRSIHELHEVQSPISLAIGVFDGLHLGHQEVIRAAQEHAAQHHGSAVVMSFEPHPLRVLRPAQAPRLLCGADYQMRLLEQMGISAALLCPFTQETAQTSAPEFVAALVRACDPLGCISVGYTWAFGKDRGGDIHALMDLGQQHDFAVYGVPPIRIQGEVVSSTLIREAVIAGEFEKASRLLGRPYALYGQVMPGRQLARQLGYPTANVRLQAELLPPYGVYSVRVEIASKWLSGIANLGVRPTVDDQDAAPILEVYVFDWNGDLYGQSLEVQLGAYMRPEMKFDSVDALRTQIESDVRQARLFT